jgi:hypothetical protein
MGDSPTLASQIEVSRGHQKHVRGSLGVGNLAGCSEFVAGAVGSPWDRQLLGSM